ncbi:MAG: hypothetical protein ABI577_16590 [bacterium]
MGEKETARESATPSISERTAAGGGGDAASEHVYQHNQTDMEFRDSGHPADGSGDRALRGKPSKEQ